MLLCFLRFALSLSFRRNVELKIRWLSIMFGKRCALKSNDFVRKRSDLIANVFLLVHADNHSMDRDNLVTLIEDHIPIYKLRAESEQTSKCFCFLNVLCREPIGRFSVNSILRRQWCSWTVPRLWCLPCLHRLACDLLPYLLNIPLCSKSPLNFVSRSVFIYVRCTSSRYFQLQRLPNTRLLAAFLVSIANAIRTRPCLIASVSPGTFATNACHWQADSE